MSQLLGGCFFHAVKVTDVFDVPNRESTYTHNRSSPPCKRVYPEKISCGTVQVVSARENGMDGSNVLVDGIPTKSWKIW